jgi:hypothetical protein
MRTKLLWATALVVLCGLTTAGGVTASGGSTAPIASLVGVHSQAALPMPLYQASWVVAQAYPSTIVRYGFVQVGSDSYVIGGVSDGSRVTTMNRYNAATNTWTPRAAVPVASEAPSAAYYNGKIYLAEGDTGNSLRIYNIASNTWSSGAPRAAVTDGYGAAAGAYNGRVYVAGGGTTGPGSSATWVYNIASNTWSPGTPAPVSFYIAGYHQDGKYLYVVGGFNGATTTNLTETMRLDMSNGTWSSGPAFTPQRADFALAMSGTKLYAIGGDANGGAFFDSVATVNELNTSSWPGGSWTASPNDLPSVRQGNQAGFFSTGRVGGEIWSTGGIQGATFTFLPDNLYRLSRPKLTVGKAGSGAGTVSSSPAGIDCGASCVNRFDDAAVVTLTATPAAGSRFAGWSAGCTGNGTCTVPMTADSAVIATFIQLNTLTVKNASPGAGTVTSAPAGISCGATCAAIYDYGTSVTLTATKKGQATFGGWGGACSGTGACVVSMTSDRAVTAKFKLPCKVPKVVGLSLKKAKARIKKANCRVGKVKKASSSHKKKGKVIKQSPKAGKRLKNGGKVNLTVGKGP